MIFKWIIPNDMWDDFKLDTLIYIQAIIYKRFDKTYVIFPVISRQSYEEIKDYGYPNVVDRTRKV